MRRKGGRGKGGMMRRKGGRGKEGREEREEGRWEGGRMWKVVRRKREREGAN